MDWRSEWKKIKFFSQIDRNPLFTGANKEDRSTMNVTFNLQHFFIRQIWCSLSIVEQVYKVIDLWEDMKAPQQLPLEMLKF